MTDLTPYSAAAGLVRVYPATASTHTHRTPGLVWAHGGGFGAGDLDMPEADWVARAFAEHGITVVSIDYRLATDRLTRFPAGSDDVLAAWSWTLEHSEELGIDPARLVIGGASAGANLATGAVLRLLGQAPPTAPAAIPAAVFLAYPTLLAVQPAPDAALRAVLDANPHADYFGPSVVRAMYENYLGGPVEDAPLAAVPGMAKAADLVRFPSTMVVNSEFDELRLSGEVFVTTLTAAGVPVDLTIEVGTEHGHLNRPDEEAATATVERVIAWMERAFVPAEGRAHEASGSSNASSS